MRSAISLILPLLLICPPLQACMNDTQTFLLEQEFRSSYESQDSPGSALAPTFAGAHSAGLPRHYEWSGLGISLALTG